MPIWTKCSRCVSSTTSARLSRGHTVVLQDKIRRGSRERCRRPFHFLAAGAIPRRTYRTFFRDGIAQHSEARIYKALDKMEAIIQHNEADVSTWLPLEYDLNLTYGVPESHAEPYLERLRAYWPRSQNQKRPNTMAKAALKAAFHLSARRLRHSFQKAIYPLRSNSSSVCFWST